MQQAGQRQYAPSTYRTNNAPCLYRLYCLNGMADGDSPTHFHVSFRDVARIPPLGDGVATIHTQVRPRDIARGIAEQERDRTHQVLGPAHLALWDQARPLLRQFWIIVEDLLRPVTIVSLPPRLI